MLLLLRPDFPRSVRFCLEAAARALTAIEGPAAGRGLGEADRLLGLVLGDLRFRMHFRGGPPHFRGGRPPFMPDAGPGTSAAPEPSATPQV